MIVGISKLNSNDGTVCDGDGDGGGGGGDGGRGGGGDGI